ncbi:MAG TPA: epimerase [Microscillaceae bacterium]|nr:epimerase [Microscillaceae bacterium]
MVFITGCNGLVGSFIARQFLKEGHRVRALKRQNSNLQYLSDIQDQIEWVEGDVLDVTTLYEVLQACDQVVHSAAVVSFAANDKEMMYKVNVEGTANIVNICLELGINKLAFISSVAAIGRKKDSEVIDETSKWEDSKLNTYYAQTKHLAEMEVWRGHAEGLDTIIVNPSVVIGPSHWDRSSTQLFKYVWDEKKYYATGSLNYVDARDVAKVVFQLMAGEFNGERYILNAGNVQYKAFFEHIAKAFGKRPPHRKVTPLLAAIAWRVAWFQSLFTRQSPVITRETAYMSQKHFYYKNAKVVNALNFKFHTLEESINWASEKLLKKQDLSVSR